MSDIDGPIDWIEDEDTSPRALSRIGMLVRAWGGPLAALCLLLAALVALLAAHLLAHADLGTRLRARTCDASPLVPLALFMLAGALLTLAPRVLLLRTATTIVTRRLALAAISASVPAALFALSLPGTLGCSAARTIARWQLLGDALTGTAGVALCVATALALGSALMRTLHVGTVSAGDLLAREQPTIVEMAILEADELERDADLRRFRGVD
jgi:hypothetical protein